MISSSFCYQQSTTSTKLSHKICTRFGYACFDAVTKKHLSGVMWPIPIFFTLGCGMRCMSAIVVSWYEDDLWITGLLWGKSGSHRSHYKGPLMRNFSLFGVFILFPLLLNKLLGQTVKSVVIWDAVATMWRHCNIEAGLIPGLLSANERWRYCVTTSLFGWAQA